MLMQGATSGKWLAVVLAMSMSLSRIAPPTLPRLRLALMARTQCTLTDVDPVTTTTTTTNTIRHSVCFPVVV